MSPPPQTAVVEHPWDHRLKRTSFRVFVFPLIMASTVCCSAPGKVLITGGYLILERPHAGLVLTVNARFYTIIKHLNRRLAGKASTCLIEVISPQFDHVE